MSMLTIPLVDLSHSQLNWRQQEIKRAQSYRYARDCFKQLKSLASQLEFEVPALHLPTPSVSSATTTPRHSPSLSPNTTPKKPPALSLSPGTVIVPKESLRMYLEKWRENNVKFVKNGSSQFHAKKEQFSHMSGELRRKLKKSAVDKTEKVAHALRNMRTEDDRYERTVSRMREVKQRVLDRLSILDSGRLQQRMENVRSFIDASPLAHWDALEPSRLPTEHEKYFKLWKKKEDVHDLPTTRCEAFFPEATSLDVQNLMVDVPTRLAWDRNLTDFRPLSEEGDVFYHKIESATLKRFGFHGREFFYERQVASCGEGCRDITLQSISDEAADGYSKGGEDGSVRGTIHYQNYRIQEEEREGAKGAKLTITAVVDTGARPPKYISTLLCKLMAAQPYLWMVDHLATNGVGGGTTAQISTATPHNDINTYNHHFAILE